MVRVFANGPGDQGSIAGQVIPKTQKWYLLPPGLTLSCTKNKVEQSRGKGLCPPLHPGVVAIEKGTFWSPSTKVANYTFIIDNKNKNSNNNWMQ